MRERRGRRGETAGGGTVDSAGEELEVGGEADMRGRPGSERREGGERWWAGGGVGGLERNVGRAGKRKRGRKGRWAAQAAGPQGLLGHGWKRKKGEREEREGFRKFSSLFFTFSNSHFKLFLNSNLLHKFSQTISQLFLRTFSQVF
jgi:hypothetical protein